MAINIPIELLPFIVGLLIICYSFYLVKKDEDCDGIFIFPLIIGLFLSLASAIFLYKNLDLHRLPNEWQLLITTVNQSEEDMQIIVDHFINSSPTPISKNIFNNVMKDHCVWLLRDDTIQLLTKNGLLIIELPNFESAKNRS